MSALLLLADSQLLFRPAQLPQLLQRARPRSAAYIGAANGHQPEFFELAQAALATLYGTLYGQPVPCHFIRNQHELPAQPSDLVIMAGGSVTAGWEFLQQPWLQRWLNACRAEADAVFIGVSAGAIHLASGCDPERPSPRAQTYLGWAPLFIAAHEETQQWPSRQCWQTARQAPDSTGQDFTRLAFAGLPMGAGLWWEAGIGQSMGKPGLQWDGVGIFPPPQQPDQQ
ncbi:MAG TPA: hypothetical protein VM553_07120 [Dongiaceae bacterium]|nr:hypothetical protein [Dongiaceae bacterium]